MPDLSVFFGGAALMLLAFAVGLFVGHDAGYRSGYSAIADKEMRARAIDASLRKSEKRAGKAVRKSAKAARQ